MLKVYVGVGVLSLISFFKFEFGLLFLHLWFGIRSLLLPLSWRPFLLPLLALKCRLAYHLHEPWSKVGSKLSLLSLFARSKLVFCAFES